MEPMQLVHDMDGHAWNEAQLRGTHIHFPFSPISRSQRVNRANPVGSTPVCVRPTR